MIKIIVSSLVALLIATLPIVLPIGPFWLLAVSSVILLANHLLNNSGFETIEKPLSLGEGYLLHVAPMIVMLLCGLFFIGMVVRSELTLDQGGVIIGLLLSVAIYYMVIIYGLNMQIVFYSMYICAVLGGTVGFADYVLIGISRTGGIYSAMMFGPIGALLFTYFITLLFFNFKQTPAFDKWLSGIGVAFSLVMVISSGTKIALVFLAVIALVLFVYFKAWKYRGFYIGTLVLAVTLLFSVDLIQRQTLYKRMVSDFASTWEYVIDGNQNIKSSPTVRIEMWRAGLEILKENPVWGVGTQEMYRLVKEVAIKHQFTYSITRNETHLHNDYVDIAVRYGLVGLAIFMSLYVFAFYIFFKNQWMSPFYKAAYLAYLVGFLTFGISGATYTYIFGEIFIFGGIPVLIALVLHNRPRQVKNLDNKNNYLGEASS